MEAVEYKLVSKALTASDDKYFVEPYQIYYNLLWLNAEIGPGAGDVAGGASWRMVVDLANPAHSFGVYPGGESEDPANPHYDDQVTAWAEGKYLPLYFNSSPAGFQTGQVESLTVLTPP